MSNKRWIGAITGLLVVMLAIMAWLPEPVDFSEQQVNLTRVKSPAFLAVDEAYKEVVYNLHSRFRQAHARAPKSEAELLQWLIIHANSGSVAHQTIYGLLLYKGLVKPTGQAPWHQWLLEADKQDSNFLFEHYPAARSELLEGVHQLAHESEQADNGQNDETRVAQAMQWYQFIATLGDVRGESKLAHAYFYGIDVAQSNDLAQLYSERAAAKGDASASLIAAKVLLLASSPISRSDLAIEYLLVAANQDNIEAQLLLAKLYQSGSAEVKSAANAAIWLEKAAQLGSVEAMLALAKLYQNPDFIEFDQAQAQYWLEQASGKADKPSVDK